jgi:hypothetical protein
VRTPRALFFVAAASLAACGGFLGFGDDDDEGPAPAPPADSSVDEGGNNEADGAGNPTDATNDAALDAIVFGDAGVDAVDDTPVDASHGALVYATFETNLTGGDGADLAENMARTKTGAIGGSESAVTELNRPANLAWTFQAEPSLSLVFSVRIISKPKAAAAELMRLTGSGAAVHVVITSDGNFFLRSNGVNSAGPTKMDTGVTYRVGVSINANNDGQARAGFTTSMIPSLTDTVPWAAGTMSNLQIRTDDPEFAYLVDDVFVTTKTP